jgi:hypothetical protein
MKFTLREMSEQLIIVAQGYGTDNFDQQRFFREYRFKKGFEIRHIWLIANNSLKQGYFRFEPEALYIKHHLPSVIEPKHFFVRHFTKWQ